MIEVIMLCLTTAQLSILWNGEPMDYFKPTRGIRQGDPLSPYLYVICMERLAHLIDDEWRKGNWRAAKASRNGPQITNLAFADDLILFCEADLEQAKVVESCLKKFCDASGSKVSCEKSRVFFSHNTNMAIRERVCETLRMEETSDFGTYLGVPTINGRVTRGNYQFLVDRVNSKLNGWKAKTLSLAGRATLIQSSLSTVPFYAMQTTNIPKGVCDLIDKQSRSFLWGSTEEKRGVHLVNWQQVTKPKREGGLGITAMRQANAAFLTKLGWRLLSEPTSLWSRVMRSKYCQNRCDVDMFVARPDASNAWRGIVSNRDTLKKGISMAVGGGKNTFFWHHSWVHPTPLLQVAHPEPPLAVQDATVREMWEDNVGWRWEKFADYLPTETLQTIQAHEIVEDTDEVDKVYWNGSPSGGFTLSSAIQIIRSTEPEVGINGCDWKGIWKLGAPQRIRMFLWLLCLEKIMSNKERFVRNLTDNPSCYVCGEDEESTSHIMRECPASILIWKKLGYNSIEAERVKPMHEWVISNIHGKAQGSSEWPLIFGVTCWWLWKWRNARCFETDPSIPIDQVSFILARVGDINKALEKHNTGVLGTARSMEYIRWIAPKTGWVRLNTDGASKGNPGPSGAGGIIRDQSGATICAFAADCGVVTVTKAELVAVLRGLCVAWNHRFSQVALTLDSVVVKLLLVGEEPTNSPYYHLIKKCRSLIARDGWEVTVEHCYREANRAADWLANYGVQSGQKLELIEAIPSDLYAVLLEDLGGVAWARSVPARSSGY